MISYIAAGCRRLVALVVAEAAVADQVDHEVLVELLAVGVGEPRRPPCTPPGSSALTWTDRDLEPLGKVAGVGRGPRVPAARW
jgi:hypothetical protein